MLADSKLELKKHVAIIHCNNKLTLLQRKIVNALLFHAYDHLLSKEFHTIHIQELNRLVGYDSNDIKKVKLALMKLLSTVIEWNLVDKQSPESSVIWNASAIISDASIEGSKCTYSYSRKMRELLHHPEMYGKINLQVQSKFKSGYGLSLYENCIRYQNLHQTPWFDISLLRKLLGVSEDLYEKFRDFKRRVLVVAIEDVNKNSPVRLDVEYKRVGRNVESVQFLISKKTPSLNMETKTDTVEIDKELSELFLLSAVQIEHIHKDFKLDYIYQKIKIVKESRNFKTGNIKNMAGYFLKALADDFKPMRVGEGSDHRNMVQQKFYSRDDNNKSNIMTQVEDKWEQFQSLDENIRKQYVDEFKKKIKGTPCESIYEREGLENFVLKNDFVEFFKNRVGQ